MKTAESTMMKRFVSSKWFKARPRAIQEAVKKYPPFCLYLMNTGQIASIYSYAESPRGKCSKCTVIILEGYNKGFRVFDVPLTDLVKRCAYA